MSSWKVDVAGVGDVVAATAAEMEGLTSAGGSFAEASSVLVRAVTGAVASTLAGVVEEHTGSGYEIDDRILQQDTASRDALTRIIRTIEQAEDDCVSALTKVSGGTGDDLPQPLGPSVPGVPATPDWTVAADEFGATVSRSALDALAELHASNPDAAEQYAAEHEADFTSLIATPPSVDAANAWWEALPPAASTALTALVPLVVGNMGGVPYSTRDTALRKYVNAYTPSGKNTAWDTTVAKVKQQPERKGVVTPRQLVTLDQTDPDQPRAAISVGVLDDADTVTYLVPGMDTTPQNDEAIPSWMSSADALQAEQLRLDAG